MFSMTDFNMWFSKSVPLQMQNRHTTFALWNKSALWASVLERKCHFSVLGLSEDDSLEVPSLWFIPIISDSLSSSILKYFIILMDRVAWCSSSCLKVMSLSLHHLLFNLILAVTHFALLFSLLISLCPFHVWIVPQWLRFTLSPIVKIFRKRMCLHSLLYLYGTIEYKWLLLIMHLKMTSYLKSVLLF